MLLSYAMYEHCWIQLAQKLEAQKFATEIRLKKDQKVIWDTVYSNLRALLAQLQASVEFGITGCSQEKMNNSDLFDGAFVLLELEAPSKSVISISKVFPIDSDVPSDTDARGPSAAR